jgi:sialidase-1
MEKQFMTVDGIQSVGAKSPIYVDKTDNVFEVEPGNTLYFEQFGFAGEWMHAYAYIDYNNDFVFGTELNIDGDTEGELVSHNFYSATDAEYGTTSRGQSVKNGNANNTNSYEGSQGLPHFTLPADLAAGDYRMRIKTDWNNLDPNFAGHTKQNEPKTIGACQVDIIIRIVGDEEPGVDTAIDNVNVEGEQVIYDITGRRIEKINAAGVYIVNGVKVLVK